MKYKHNKKNVVLAFMPFDWTIVEIGTTYICCSTRGYNIMEIKYIGSDIKEAWTFNIFLNLQFLWDVSICILTDCVSLVVRDKLLTIKDYMMWCGILIAVVYMNWGFPLSEVYTNVIYFIFIKYATLMFVVVHFLQIYYTLTNRTNWWSKKAIHI